MGSYMTPKEGEWVQPVRNGYKFQCCDCGSVHAIDFRVTDDVEPRVQFRAFRDNRATAAVRRERKKRETNGN